MQLPIQLTFRDLGPSESISDYVRKRAEKLDTFFDRITGCRIAIESPHRHRHQGRHYRIRIDLTVPGDELVVGTASGADVVTEDVYAAIDGAFDDAQRVLQDYVRRRRGDVKPHEKRLRGRVTKLFAYEGFGFIETPDGDDVYFHRNSVLRHGFERMKIGTKVRFVDELGQKGRQASTVIVAR